MSHPPEILPARETTTLRSPRPRVAAAGGLAPPFTGSKPAVLLIRRHRKMVRTEGLTRAHALGVSPHADGVPVGLLASRTPDHSRPRRACSLLHYVRMVVGPGDAPGMPCMSGR